MTESIQIKNQNFIMHASGVLFWEAQSMLLISDVHLGKVSHFRKFGAAVPQKAIQKNFDLLNEAVAFFKPNTIVFMGDLFHSSLNKEWDLFEKWSAAITSKIILVSGNHDIISPLKYEDLRGIYRNLYHEFNHRVRSVCTFRRFRFKSTRPGSTKEKWSFQISIKGTLEIPETANRNFHESVRYIF